MLEFIESIGGWGNISAAALLGFAIILVLSGKIVPKKTVDFLASERDLWKASAESKDAVIKTQAETNDLLVREIGETVIKVLNALPSGDKESKKDGKNEKKE